MAEKSQARPSSRSSFWSNRWLVFTLAILPILLITASMAIVRPDLRTLSTYGYLGVFGIMLLGNATVLLPMPGLATVAAAGVIWNPLFVGLAGGLGGATGELTGYLAGCGANQLVDANKVKWFQRFEAFVRRYGFLAILLLAAIPNPLFDVVGVAAGSLCYPAWRFFIAVAIGNTIKCSVIALAGGALGGALLGG